MRESTEAQAKLDNLLLACFSVQKMYGRQPENIEVINQVFHRILGKYRGNRVLMAFEAWMERSQEFPTPADIVSLLKRNGRPPLSKEIYISISKKEPEFRNSNDWQYLREYEAQAHEEGFGSDFTDEKKEDESTFEIKRLRAETAWLRAENEKLAKLLHEARVAKGIEKPEITHEQKVNNTLEYLKSIKAPEIDIQEFIATCGIPASSLKGVVT